MTVTIFKTIALLAALAMSVPTNAADFTKSVAFPQGKASTAIQGSVVRGDRDNYLLRVRSGQVMSVEVTALENNAAFSIFEPKADEPIPGTESEHDRAKWSGVLAKSGIYRIEVGGTRGNAQYTLRISVK